jgi:hypothetical protein
MPTAEITMTGIKEMAIVASFIIPIVTGIVAAIKAMVPESAARFMPAVSILVGVTISLLIFGFTVPGGVVGLIIGLGATGLWEAGKTTIAGK